MFLSDLLYSMSFSPSDEYLDAFLYIVIAAATLLVTVVALCWVIPLRSYGIGRAFFAALVANLVSFGVVLALLLLFG
jgi:hypothetical protein